MPLVRISLTQSHAQSTRKAIGDVVHQSMVDTINCPPEDRFQVIHIHAREDFLYAAEYLGVPHSDDLVIIQITLNEGRTVELKQALYRAIADGIAAQTGISVDDVFINLVEVKKENWSFGQGVAQYA